MNIFTEVFSIQSQTHISFDEFFSKLNNFHIVAVKEYDDLIDFIETRMCNDLHSGNFATINGEIVIVDFSGYWTDKELEDFE